MIQNITQSDFTAAFHRAGRGDHFTHKGLIRLYEHLTELEESCDMQIELDVIALCCEYSEYSDFEELQADYSNLELSCLSEYRDYTEVIEMDNGGIIIAAF